MKLPEHPIRDANDQLEHALHLDARRKLRVVAVYDVVKGLLVLAAGIGVLEGGRHVLESGGLSLLALFGLDARLAWSRQFLAFLHAADAEKGVLVLVIGAYAALHFVEAWGLWRLRNWARWLGLVAAGLFVPFELYYLFRAPSLSSAAVLSVNLAVLWLLWPRRPLLPSLPEASNA